MKFTYIKDLKYSKADKSSIDLLATCKEYGEIPMTLNLVDTEDNHHFATGKFEIVLEKQMVLEKQIILVEGIEKEIEVLVEKEIEVQKEIFIPLEEYCKTLEIAPYVEPEIVVMIPQSITMRQARLYLLSVGLLDDVELIVQGNRAQQIEWEYANEVLRTNQLIPALQASLGLLDSDIDTMFIEASKL